MNYRDDAEKLCGSSPKVAREVADFRGVSDVMTWMQTTGRTKAQVDIIGQDEFHYDFLVELGERGEWVAFGIT